AAGTVIVKDIAPGVGWSSPAYLTAVGNTLYFVAYDATNGTELWKSDGTAAGTVMVKDINPGAISSSSANLTAVGNTLYFTADDGTNGTELWKSDGTAAGTVMVKDTVPTGGAYTGVVQVTADGWMVYCNADATAGGELWVTDGTEANTFMLQDINPNGSSSPSQFTKAGNSVFFTANDGVTGTELWVLPPSAFDRGTFNVTANVPAVMEDAGTATFTVTRAGSFGPASVNYATSGNTATAGQDFTAVSGTLSFAHGETSKTITVTILDDTLDEADETLLVSLSSPTNGAVLGAQPTAVETIIDNDVAATISVAAGAAVVEGDSGSVYQAFTISLSGASGQSVQVSYATSDVTATAFSDYFPTSGVATLLPGSTSVTVYVPIFGDVVHEADETFNFDLAFPLNATAGVMHGVGTILDDDPLPVVNLDGPYSITEGQTVSMTASVVSSKGAISSYVWDFGDGSTTTGAATSHIYAQQGNYTVGVTVTDSYGLSSLTTTTATILDTAPVASFSMDKNSGSPPLTVTFTDASTAYDGITSWNWDFGDGNSSTNQNPLHTFASAGNYTVTLTVTDGDGSVASALQSVAVNGAGSASLTTVDDIGDVNGNGTPDIGVLQSDATGTPWFYVKEGKNGNLL
ncbi:MAG: PKD domain-containing protein, partial [Candidatus Zixiibacteriota bacterium]